ncbi:MAG TPA: PVC-type heme-binding CxxCH protein [Pricia sp.]|nr:PVC-type heme-binding CxxCH protein [Pricia sp.]
MKTFSTFPLYLLVALVFLGCKSDQKKEAARDDAPRSIQLLFLGHAQEHHNSRAYQPILSSALARDGIHLTYTEDVNDLNTENLEKYDGVILYANYEGRHPEQEEALMDYVSAGHAFIPIHCASFCFKDSEAYIDMVGGRFSSHGTGTFTADIVDRQHSITKDLQEFSVWDETYVHDKIAEDITVLMERTEGDHREPWTWTKQYGKGKVFYTAYGHDERVWTHPGFQELIKQGILWAVSDQVKKNWSAFAADIPELRYEDRDSIPNYEKRDPAPEYQLPLSPEESAKLIQVPPGFDLELFASEPDIINPIDINWDEKGRLWVIETVDYPNTVRYDKGVGDDRIKILEDTDNDGRADKVTVFAEDLNIPTSFVFYDGGIVVSQAPHFLFLKDTDGDDRADVREIMIDGWGTFDTHAGPSNLQYGIDNNIYGVVGYSGFEGNIYGEELDFNQNMYRFNPKEAYFEVLTNTSNNTWGLGITEDNSLFASTANNTHSVFLGIPNRIMEGLEGIPAQGSRKIDGHYDMRPITQNYRQVDVFGGFTAAAGHHFYTARTYPKEYWNKYAFVCEPTGGLVHIAKIERDGAGYVEKDGGNLFAGADEWVSPVAAKVGPDGNVWVADWYNFIVQHNPTPNEDRGGYDAENGEGNAYINPLRDKSHGRIWRIVPEAQHRAETRDRSESGEGHKTTSLDKEDPEALLDALSDDNMFWRLTAQRLLTERGNTDVLPELYTMVNDSRTDAMGLNPAALHALWTIEGLGAMASDPEARNVVGGALYHPSAAVRKAAIQILPKDGSTDAALQKAKLLHDRDPGVVLATLLYWADRPATSSTGKRLYELSEDETVAPDEWLSKALYAAAASHSDGFMEAYARANPGFDPNATNDERREAVGYDDADWKTMRLPQSIEEAGLDMDGIIWFRRNFDFDPTGPTFVSLGPVDDSDVVYINGEQVGDTEQDYTRNRWYEVPQGLLKKSGNTIAVRVEDTGGNGGIYGDPEQMFVRSGDKTVRLSGTWKYEIESDYAQGVNKPFEGMPVADVFAKNYVKSETGPNEDVPDSADVNATIINIKTVKNEMKYDVTEFVVQAGKPVELILENPDFMQHNLVIVQRGAKEKVGTAADKMAADPDAAERQYVPDMAEVLYATDLIDPQQKAVLKFIAPSEPGEYPFICTFPGHWRIMQGVMKVVPSEL